ncbi:MAG TPA: hypothetical protein VJ464_16845 [Blastocatellia bacterium]|nr:hypothetical protein [Blastocatellia bacterium]
MAKQAGISHVHLWCRIKGEINAIQFDTIAKSCNLILCRLQLHILDSKAPPARAALAL